MSISIKCVFKDQGGHYGYLEYKLRVETFFLSISLSLKNICIYAI